MAPHTNSNDRVTIKRCKFETRGFTNLEKIVLMHVEKKGITTTARRQEWRDLKKNVEETGREHKIRMPALKVDNLIELVVKAKEALVKQLRYLIVDVKMSRIQVTKALYGWENYINLRFCRQEIQKEEEEMWAEQALKLEMEELTNPKTLNRADENMDEEEPEDRDDVKEELEIVAEEEEDPVAPICIVVDPSNTIVMPRIKTVEEHLCKVPFSCSKAIDGMENGSKELLRNYSGIPNRKFKMDKVDAKLGSWPVQSAIEDKENPGNWLVHFEGVFGSESVPEKELKRLAPAALKDGKRRVEFLKSIDTDPFLRDKTRYGKMSLSMHFDDMSYIHSKIHEKYGLGPVTYMAIRPSTELPPAYENLPVNLMQREVLEYCLAKKESRPISTVKGTTSGKGKGCENPDGCQCQKVFESFYRSKCSQNLEPDGDGLLDFTDFDPEHRRILIECSDACGCSINCPRRTVQRMKTQPTVVYHEGGMGYCLRSQGSYRPGEFIGEYTGWLKFPKDTDDHSYEASVDVMATRLVICSREMGSIARFMSHSCDPSATFVVTHSRVKESDPLIPRVAVFALKEIKMGEPITIRYYTKEDLRGLKKSLKCLCQTDKCVGMLPG